MSKTIFFCTESANSSICVALADHLSADLPHFLWLVAPVLDNTKAQLRPFHSQMLGETQGRTGEKKDKEKQEERKSRRESFRTHKQEAGYYMSISKKGLQPCSLPPPTGSLDSLWTLSLLSWLILVPGASRRTLGSLSSTYCLQRKPKAPRESPKIPLIKSQTLSKPHPRLALAIFLNHLWLREVDCLLVSSSDEIKPISTANMTEHLESAESIRNQSGFPLSSVAVG